MKDLWVLLYSFEQECFHYEPLSKTVEINLKQFITGGFANDYKIIYIGKDREELKEFHKKLKELMIEKDNSEQTG